MMQANSLSDKKIARKNKMDSIRSSLKMLTLPTNTRLVETAIHERRKRKESMSGVTLPELEEPWLNYAPTQFDEHYECKEKIGEGAHGIVRRCVHKETGKQYAVKILSMDSEQVMFLKSNFLDVKKLKHNCIIRYKALHLSPRQNICYLIMQYLPYPNLLAVRLQGEEQLRRVFQDILEALAYVHANNMCHRDIKPQNILFNPTTEEVKIIDFGVSKNLKKRGRYEQMLTVTGTQYYRAPEMFLGGGYNQKVDSWAVGITLYKLITRRTPFETEYHSDTIDNILNQQVDLSIHPFEEYSSLMKNLLVRLLKKDRKERLTCTDAAKHVWFTPSAEETSLSQSDVGNFAFLRSNTNETPAQIANVRRLEKMRQVNEMIELGQQRHIKVESPIDKKEFRKRMKENDLLEEDQWNLALMESDQDIGVQSPSQMAKKKKMKKMQSRIKEKDKGKENEMEKDKQKEKQKEKDKGNENDNDNKKEEDKGKQEEKEKSERECRREDSQVNLEIGWEMSEFLKSDKSQAIRDSLKGSPTESIQITALGGILDELKSTTEIDIDDQMLSCRRSVNPHEEHTKEIKIESLKPGKQIQFMQLTS